MLQPKDVIYGFSLNSPIFMISSFEIKSTLIEAGCITYSLQKRISPNELSALRDAGCNEDDIDYVKFLDKDIIRAYQEANSDVLVCHKGWKFFTDLGQAEMVVRDVIHEREQKLNEELRKLQDLNLRLDQEGLLVLSRLSKDD